jgi:alkylhydroperoxidase family enzyme
VLLRASSEHDGSQVDLGNIFARGLSNSTVAHAELLLNFAEAVVANSADDAADPQVLRRAIEAEMGQQALVDVAAVVAIFNAVVIVADATGIPLEPYKVALSEDLRADLGLDAFQLM